MHGDGGAVMSAAADVRPARMGAPQGFAPAGGAGVLRRYGAAGGTRDAELGAVSAGGDLAGMRAAAEVQGTAAAERRGAAAGEVATEFRFKEVAGESGTAAPDSAGRQLSGAERKRFGFRQSRVGQEPSSDGAGPGTGGGAGAPDALHQVRAADAGLTSREAGSAAEPGDQTAGPL